MIDHAARLRSMVTASKGIDADPDGILAAADEIDRLMAALREVVAKDKTGFARGALAIVARAALRPQSY